MEVSRRSLMTGGIAAGAAGGLVLLGPVPAEAATLPTLRIGMHGSAVTTLQSRLSRLGYWLGAVDGSFGSLTQQAVFAIQKASGITRDGVVAGTTWSKVNAGVRPTWRTKTGSLVEVDKARQLLKVIRGGSLSVILSTSTGSGKRYISSNGNWATALTPSGSFKVWYAINGMDHGPLGDLWRPRFFNGGIAVHGSTSIPPYPASHGCCRVSNSAMNMVWSRNYMPMGSRVLVY